MLRLRAAVFLCAISIAVSGLGEGYYPWPGVPEMIGPGAAARDDSSLAPAPSPTAGDEVVFEMAPIEPLPPPPKLWSGSFDAGLNGSQGNSRVFNFRFNAAMKRETPGSILNLKLNYVNTATSGTQNANRLFFDGRDEWVLGDSPWTVYAHTTTEYDQFRAFDLRITGDAGIGYRFIKNDCTSLTGRLGPGFSKEFGGPENRVRPELVTGGAFEHKVSKRQSIMVSVDYFPDVTNFRIYRINSQLAWTFLLDEVNNLSLKLSLTDRYDSNPHGAKPNDLDYAATLLWQF